MAQLPNVAAQFNGPSAEQPFGSTSSLNDLDLDDFLDLMIAELQNQDPLNPLDNAELVGQISQIREVGATDRLTETLDAVLLGQNISSATNLIGADIEALSDDNQRVNGVVSSISVANGEPKLHLDLNPSVKESDEPGEIEAGDYEYRVVWREEGTLFGVDPLSGGSVSVGNESAVQISNLPVSAGGKQVYRAQRDGAGQFKLVGSIANGTESSFLDTTSNANLSNAALPGEPQLIVPQRSFTVSLKNIGEIRPPGR